MVKEKNVETAMLINRIVLGLLMLVPGLFKLFVFKSSGVTGMLSGMAFFNLMPGFWAWVLILSEIVFGIAILANWKLKYTVIPPIIILLVATLMSAIKWGDLMGTSWASVLLHLAAITNLWLLGARAKR